MDLITAFKKTAKNFGDYCAVESEHLRLSYLALDCWGTCLSHILKAQSGRNPFIVADLGISTYHVLTSLAIRFTNKIITVIHETYTEEQLLKCLNKLGNPLIVSTTERWARYSTINYGNIIFLDSLNLDSERNISPTLANSEFEQHEGISHCLFTSGSTGEPKAVLIKEAPLINYIRRSVEFYKHTFKPGFRQGIGSSASFLPSIMEIWRPICVGGKLVIPSPSVKIDIEKYRSWLTENLIEVIGLATPIAEILLSKDVEKLTSLQLVFFGGARLNEKKLNLKNATFDCVNMYGSTESYLVCSNRIPKGSTNITNSVGFPPPNVKVYLFDENDQLVKDKFVNGEIYVNGPSIFSGYVRDKEKTAQVLGIKPNYEEFGVLYRTGDIGYFGEDGSLFVVGRKDSQIKIHGIRLELGEVEAALMKYNHIQQAVIIPKEVNHTIQLIAYCTLTNQSKNKNIQVDEIYEFLETKLQPHAIPALILIKDTLPTLATGKVDRMKLRQQMLTDINTQENNISLTVDPIFLGVRKIWASLLKVSENEITENHHFFRTGGNSLLAVQFIKEVTEMLKELNTSSPTIGIQTLFSNPTLSKFVAYLQSRTTSSKFVEAIDFKKEIELPIDIINMVNISSTEAYSNANGILLSGLTGYLGPFLLIELLKYCSNDVIIYCIIRSNSEKDAMERVHERFHQLKLKIPKETQIKYIPGDLSKINFGLNDDKYNWLSNQISTIIHSAADVNFAKSYEDIKETTVAMTLNVIRFALHGKKKRIEFMSSIGVFDGTMDENIYKNIDYIAKEEKLPEEIIDPSRMKNAYFQSKWVSEKLLTNIHEKRNIPIGIYRIGQIGANLETGSANMNDAIAGFLIVSQLMGKYPDIRIDLPFVDVSCAREIALLCSESTKELRHFHIFGSYVGLDQLLGWNTNIQKVTLKEWLDQFEKFKESGVTEQSIIFLATLFIHGMKASKIAIGRNIQKDIKFDRTATLKALKSKINDSVLKSSPKFYSEALLSNAIKFKN